MLREGSQDSTANIAQLRKEIEKSQKSKKLIKKLEYSEGDNK